MLITIALEIDIFYCVENHQHHHSYVNWPIILATISSELYDKPTIPPPEQKWLPTARQRRHHVTGCGLKVYRSSHSPSDQIWSDLIWSNLRWWHQPSSQHRCHYCHQCCLMFLQLLSFVARGFIWKMLNWHEMAE